MFFDDTIVTSTIGADDFSAAPLAAADHSPNVGLHVIQLVLWALAQTDWSLFAEPQAAEAPPDFVPADLVGCGSADLNGAGV